MVKSGKNAICVCNVMKKSNARFCISCHEIYYCFFMQMGQVLDKCN